MYMVLEFCCYRVEVKGNEGCRKMRDVMTHTHTHTIVSSKGGRNRTICYLDDK